MGPTGVNLSCVNLGFQEIPEWSPELPGAVTTPQLGRVVLDQAGIPAALSDSSVTAKNSRRNDFVCFLVAGKCVISRSLLGLADWSDPLRRWGSGPYSVRLLLL
jgi:hypothetical protein